MLNNPVYLGEGLPALSSPAGAGDILAGKQAAAAGGGVLTGTMPHRGAVTQTLNAGGRYAIPAGYHSGSGKVTAASLASQTQATAAAADIASGKTAWVNGVKLTGTGSGGEITAMPRIKNDGLYGSGHTFGVKYAAPITAVAIHDLYLPNTSGISYIHGFLLKQEDGTWYGKLQGGKMTYGTDSTLKGAQLMTWSVTGKAGEVNGFLVWTTTPLSGGTALNFNGIADSGENCEIYVLAAE